MNKMNILIGCEFSGIVRDAFIARGHNAVSCDLEPTEKPGPHYQGDVLNLLNGFYRCDCGYNSDTPGNCPSCTLFLENREMKLIQWDLAIFFPPCTHLAGSGARWWKEKQADGRQRAAIDFFMKLVDAPIPKICIENPTGIMTRKYRKWDQIIHPFQFWDPYMKRTCLWLKNLPPLIPTNEVKPTKHWVSSSYRGGLRKDGTRKISPLGIHQSWDSKDGGKKRSLTFPGIGKAMADQWG